MEVTVNACPALVHVEPFNWLPTEPRYGVGNFEKKKKKNLSHFWGNQIRQSSKL
jgi:hypothetical protein